MKPEQAEEYTQALGQIVAGGWRQIALGEKLGVPKALGLSTREWVTTRLGGYVKISVAERHGAVSELKQQGLDQRQIAAVVGVSEATISSDVSELKSAEPVDAIAELAATNEAKQAKDKQAKRRARENKLRDEREAAMQEARQTDRRWTLEHCDIKKWRPSDVSSVVTDPPYVTPDAVELYSELADFALDVLPSGGALVALCWQPILESVMKAMARSALHFRWMLAWQFDSGGDNARTFDMARRVHDGWKPVLVYHKDGWTRDTPALYDIVRSSGRILDEHVWQQGVDGFERLVSYVSQPGDMVCDPFLGSGTTAIAALKLERNFCGADIDSAVVEQVRARLLG